MVNATTDPHMEKYYKFRKEIHKLYDHDVYNTGDLCSKVLGIRDKEKCIESAKIALQSYTINIELAADTTVEKQTEIIDKIANHFFILSTLPFLHITWLQILVE